MSTRITSARLRRGFTIIELVVSMVIVGVIGAALTKLIVAQSRFYDRQLLSRNARNVSRSALNVLASDMRMIEVNNVNNAVVEATASRFVVRVPFALGLRCTATTVLLMPTDSLALAKGRASLAGIAFRRDDGAFQYQAASVMAPLMDGNTGCQLAGLNATGATALSDLTSWTVPALSGGVLGTSVFFYATVTYEFKASVLVPGRTALWRKYGTAGTDEEIVTPFDATSGFKYYLVDPSTTAMLDVATPVAAPTGGQLPYIRGIQLVLNGASERTPYGRTTALRGDLTTSIYFRNRLD